MTPEESVRYYKQQQAYRQRREDFNKEIVRWFAEKYQPRNTKP